MSTQAPSRPTQAQSLTQSLDPIVRQQLFNLLKTHSFKTGTFTLASGETSSFYLDCRMTALHPEGARCFGQLVTPMIQSIQADAVGGVALGAAPLVSAVSLVSAQHGQNPLPGFLIRKATKGYGTSKQIEGHIAPWMRVVILEDVVTSGKSVIQGIHAVKTEYPSITIAGVIALVDRLAGGQDRLMREGIPYTSLYTIDEFLPE